MATTPIQPVAPVKPVVPAPAAAKPVAPVASTPPAPAPAPAAPVSTLPQQDAAQQTSKIDIGGKTVTGADAMKASQAGDPAYAAFTKARQQGATIDVALNAQKQATDQAGGTSGAPQGPVGATGANGGATGTSSSTTTSTETTQTGGENVDNVNRDKILAAINTGLASPQDIANQTGLPLDAVTKSLNNSPDMSYMVTENQMTNKMDTAFNDYKTQIDGINKGAFVLSASEQAQVEQVKQMYDQIRQQQLAANKNFEGAITTNEIRSGRQEFMNNISSGNYQQAVTNGIQKIQEIDSKALQATQQLQEAFKDKRYSEASKMYDELNQTMKDKSSQIAKIHDATSKLMKESYAQVKQDQETAKAVQAQKQLTQSNSFKFAGEVAPAIMDALTGNKEQDQALIDEYAAAYDIDPLILGGAVAKYQDTQSFKQTPEEKAAMAEKTAQTKADISTKAGETKFQQGLAAKGYRTINPAEAERMRAAGNDVVVSGGRAYMKEGATKIVTMGSGKGSYKVVVNSKNKVVERLGGGAVPGGSGGRVSSGGRKAAGGSEKSAVKEMTGAIAQKVGEDGFLNPDHYKQLRKQWIDAGMNATKFDSEFKGNRNPNNPNYVTSKQKATQSSW